MERRQKLAAEYDDISELMIITTLTSNDEFVEAVQALRKASKETEEISDDEFSKLADIFAEIAEKNGISMDTLQTAIELVKALQEKAEQVAAKNTEVDQEESVR